MSKELATATFDYSGVDKDTKGKLVALAGQIKRGKANYAKTVLEVGCAIHEAHELLAGDGRDGKFSAWCEEECGIERRTAYNYLWSFERFGKCETVSHFSAGAMYALAAPTAPDKAVKAALKLADKGVRVTKSVADELIEENTVETDDPKPSRSSKPLSQSDMPPTPAEDEPAQSESISTDNAGNGTTTYNDTFDPAELTSESKDAFGNNVPDELDLAFQLRAGFKEQRDKLSSIKSWITQNINHAGASILQGARQRIVTDIDQADSELKYATPYCVCVYCHNKAPKVANCNACKGLGWITEPIYKAAPKGMQNGKAKA